MSTRDLERDALILRRFLGKALAAALPTNSIKLTADSARHREEYIWVDPPWELLEGTAHITSSDDYPPHDRPDYLQRHEEWGAAVRARLDGGVLEQIRPLPLGSVELAFRGGVRLVLVDGGDTTEDQWYDDWYVRLSPAAERGSMPTSMKVRMTSFAPQLLVDDLARSIAYYEKIGFRFGEPWDGFYAIGHLDGLEVHLKESPKNQAERRWRRDNEHLDAASGVDGIEAFYEQCVANGVAILKPLTATAWGTREFYVEDPDGNILSFGGRPATAVEQ